MKNGARKQDWAEGGVRMQCCSYKAFPTLGVIWVQNALQSCPTWRWESQDVMPCAQRSLDGIPWVRGLTLDRGLTLGALWSWGTKSADSWRMLLIALPTVKAIERGSGQCTFTSSVPFLIKKKNNSNTPGNQEPELEASDALPGVYRRGKQLARECACTQVHASFQK